jgi:hypothetical protein
MIDALLKWKEAVQQARQKGKTALSRWQIHQIEKEYRKYLNSYVCRSKETPRSSCAPPSISDMLFMDRGSPPG